MAYDRKISQLAAEELRRRRSRAEEIALENEERFFAACPRAGEIQALQAANAVNILRVILTRNDVRGNLEDLQKKSLALQAEYDALLAQAGFTWEDLRPRYSCPICQDTGSADGKICDCLRQLKRSLAYRELSMSVPLEKCSFENFDPALSDDPKERRQMEHLLTFCRQYADNFTPQSESLLFQGGTGLGKTHLSLAIAARAIEKGFGVIYGTAQSFAVQLERERFRAADEEEPDTHSRLTECDLLILDDLGTEFSGAVRPDGGLSYVTAALYDILNLRLLAGKPTIISTNLNVKEMEKRYSERFVSRIWGNYRALPFRGKDVRILLKKRQQEGKA